MSSPPPQFSTLCLLNALPLWFPFYCVPEIQRERKREREIEKKTETEENDKEKDREKEPEGRKEGIG